MNQLLDLPFFTDEQRALARALDESARNHLWPDAEVVGDEPALRTALKTLGNADILKCAVSTGWSLRINVLIREVLAYYSGIADIAYVMQALGGVPILLGGTPEQQESVLPGAATGEHCLAFAITEPGAGSDLSRIALHAARDGDDYVLNGTKHLVSNVGVATHYTLFARTAEGRKGVTAFIVPAQLQGLSFEKQVPTAPHPLGRLAFEDARIPVTARLGEEGEGMKLALATLGRMRATVAAAANGFARRALDEALIYTRGREMFDSTLSEQPIAQGILAEMKARLDASRLLTYRAAWLFDHGQERIPLEAGIAKWQSTENAQWIIDKALQLAGGLGALRGSIFERLYREIRPLRIYEGASEVQQLLIARAMLE
jgi:acyl-CoA dehydrogenase